MDSGIYEIKNTLDGKRYVGSSVDIKSRWQGHRANLRGGSHANVHLQSAWVKYGEAAFSFSVLETVPTDSLVEVEQRYLDEMFQDTSKIYNMARAADCPMRGRKQTEEWKANMSLVMTGRKRENPDHKPMLGKQHSEETKQKISEAKTGAEQHDNTVATQFKPGMQPWNLGAVAGQCKNGHELTADNLYLGTRKDGRAFRNCKACALTARQNYLARKAG